MAKKKRLRRADTSLIRKNFSVGSRSAENDSSFLFDCFVENDAYSEIISPENSKSILLGRTGTGKTAIIKYIKKNQVHCYEFDVASMAFNYIANNTTIRTLEEQGVDLMIFFQILWKHALCLEIIQQRWRVNSEGDQGDFLFRIKQWMNGDPKKEKALKYFEEWQGRFWISADENIKEITSKLEREFKSKLGVNLGGLVAGDEFTDKGLGEIKIEVQKVGRAIVSELQIARLNELIDLLGEYGFSREVDATRYLVIDGLDEDWADDSIRFKLIRALLETVKTFQRIRGIKLIVAIRSDVFMRAFFERMGASMQREKLYDYITEIKWSRKQLRELVDTRFAKLFKSQYGRSGVDFSTVFGDEWTSQKPFDVICDHSLERPRDVIDFLNACLKIAEGEPGVTATYLRKAEHPYSVSRKEALIDEWRSVYPGLMRSIEFLSGKLGQFTIDEMCEKDTMQWFAYTMCEDEAAQKDPLYPLAKVVHEGNELNARTALAQELAACLFRVGAVRVKISPEEPWHSCAEGVAELPPSAFGLKSRLTVHNMLRAALGAGRPVSATT